MAKSKKIYKTESGERVHGVMAEFPTPAALTHAAEKVRDSGYTRWDVFSPFPVHGMDEAMGTPMTKLPLVVGAIGLTGAALGYLLQWWVTGVAYPLVVQGKPYFAWEPYTPVTFELGVLFTAFTALLGMLAFNGLPMWHHPLFRKDRFLRVSDDRFIICIEASDPKFDPDGTRKLLEHAGGTNVDLVEEGDGTADPRFSEGFKTLVWTE
ncbi:MAG: DUF3341 domain-containing protein [Phycisphaeraceae bacterium]|nr:DUF3341 domain-containing protein [Phycisphaeraceae bacterium]